MCPWVLLSGQQHGTVERAFSLSVGRTDLGISMTSSIRWGKILPHLITPRFPHRGFAQEGGVSTLPCPRHYLRSVQERHGPFLDALAVRGTDWGQDKIWDVTMKEPWEEERKCECFFWAGF